MKNEQVLELMNTIPLGFIEEADLQAPAKRRLPRITRTGLIAACLCLALIGTAAAGVASGWIKISDLTTIHALRPDGSSVSLTEITTVSSGYAYIPWESFSQQSHDFVDSCLCLPQYKGFNSWDEVEEFLGIDIFNNPVLDQAEPFMTSNFLSLGCKQVDGSCFAGFSGKTAAPDIVSTYAFYQMKTHDSRSFILSLSAYALIGVSPDHPDERIRQHTYIETGDVAPPVAETYVTRSGLQTVITTTSDLRCHVSFLLHGIKFNLSVSFDDRELMNEGVRMVKEVLDAFS